VFPGRRESPAREDSIMDKRTLLTLATGVLPLLGFSIVAAAEEDPSAAIISLERAALERWGKGDPMGFVEIAAPEITYFDPGLERRIDGRVAFARYMEGIKGKVQLDRFDLINPHVELGGDLAMLSFNYISNRGSVVSKWNSTEVYRRNGAGWQLLHSHWSQTQPTTQ
jgi:hypothetical protein